MASALLVVVKAGFVLGNVEVLRDNLNGFLKNVAQRGVALVHQNLCGALNLFDMRASKAFVVAEGFLRIGECFTFEVKIDKLINLLWRK